MSNTIIRLMNPTTGKPATEEDRLAGNAHWIECDHTGFPLRNERGQCTAYASPENLTAREQVDAWRESDPQVATQQAPSADDTAAIRAYLAAKYGGQVAAPESPANPYA